MPSPHNSQGTSRGAGKPAAALSLTPGRTQETKQHSHGAAIRPLPFPSSQDDPSGPLWLTRPSLRPPVQGTEDTARIFPRSTIALYVQCPRASLRRRKYRPVDAGNRSHRRDPATSAWCPTDPATQRNGEEPIAPIGRSLHTAKHGVRATWMDQERRQSGASHLHGAPRPVPLPPRPGLPSTLSAALTSYLVLCTTRTYQLRSSAPTGIVCVLPESKQARALSPLFHCFH
ncbi:hypothetical protein VTI74DRAFT_6025 [Chaetomium olivicolor]